MTEPRSERGLIRYYCTAGNGMERFLIDEVKKKLAPEDVCQMPGKVLFSSSAGINRVSKLKSAERLFLLLKQDSPVFLSAYTSQVKAASLLQSKLLGVKNEWTSAVMMWTSLQGELADRRTTVNRSNTAVGVTTRTEEEKGDVKSRKSTGEQWEESANRRRKSGEQNGAQTLGKKRKRGDEEDEEREGRGRHTTWDTSCENEQNVETERRGDDEEEEERRIDFSDRAHAGPGLDPSVEISSGKVDEISKDVAEERVENEKTIRGKEKTHLQPSRVESEPSSLPVSFRISCKCTGSVSRYFSSQELSKMIGVGLSKLLGWKTDLKNPQLEINVYLSDDHCLLGIPLTRLPLANRSYIKTTGLRSTIAWAMASLAQIQPGSCVVDPMCGVGTILIEAAQEHEAACFLGVDIDDGQLQKANENIEFAKLGKRIHLLRASSLVLPLPSASVDAVVCDLPFGRKFGTKTDMAANLPLILTEMERVLCTGGTLVLLLSPQLSCQLKKLLTQKDSEPASNLETKPHTGTHDCSSPSLSPSWQQTFQIHQGIRSPPTQKRDHQSGLRHSLPQPLSSLKHQTTVRVSLGSIDGLIHKYIKTDT